MFSIAVRGMELAHQALEGLDKAGTRGTKKAISITAINIQRKAKELAPVDTGQLRSGITLTFFQDGMVARVKAESSHAAYMELGTEHSTMPPAEALAGWARRHGLPSGFAVARAILNRGGLRARPFLMPSWQEEIELLPDRIMDEILKELNR